MTTIVYRDGILAADTRAYSGDATPIGLKQKIFQAKYSNGSVTTFGISTPNPGFADEVKNWFADEKSHDSQPILADRNFTALEIHENGEVFYYSSNFTPSGPLIAPWFAIGSGVEYALGALEMGATAEEAVKAAAANDPWTGDVVQIITVLPSKTNLNDAEQELET